MNFNTRVDDYIARAEPFAQPVLTHIRNVVHKGCKSVVESIKWGMPCFDYNGKILCDMASFKQHCSFGFWLAKEMKTMEPYRNISQQKSGMGNFGKITSIKDLPAEKELISMIEEAMQLIDKGVVIKHTAPAAEKLEVPAALQKALNHNKEAKINFEKMPPSHRKDYISWVNDAKTEATRDKRIATTIEWVAEGKSRNWKYKR